MPTATCPLCGRPFTVDNQLQVSLRFNLARRHGAVAYLTPMEAVVLDLLARSYPDIAAWDRLLQANYGTAVREPHYAEQVIKVRVSHLRRKLAPLGVEIRNIYRAGYCLVLHRMEGEGLSIELKSIK